MFYIIVLGSLLAVALVLLALPRLRSRAHRRHHKWNNTRPKIDMTSGADLPRTNGTPVDTGRDGEPR